MESKLSATARANVSSPAALHRRQMLRQVWLPLAASLLIVLALAVLTLVGAANASPQVEKWGNISAIWVIFPVLFVGLVALVLVGGGAFLMRKLLRKVPYWLLVAQARVANIADLVRKIADAATKPIMKTNTFTARVRALGKQFFH